MSLAADTAKQPLPMYFIGHAGASLLFRKDTNSQVVVQNLRAIGQEILSISPPPRAILTLSGHFEASAIQGPDVIEDHGIWVPFTVMFPGDSAGNTLNIPIVQVSTFHGGDLESQVRLGETLKGLRNDGFVIVGSGMAVHSFSSVAEIAAETTDAGRDIVTKKVLLESRVLDNHIREAVAQPTSRERNEALLALEPLYEFKRSHPTVEHFTPLLVAAGAAGDAPATVLGENVIDPGFSYINVRFK